MYNISLNRYVSLYCNCTPCQIITANNGHSKENVKSKAMRKVEMYGIYFRHRRD